uniref:Uncharacterized protein n=1 Tax=Oryza barthii TaxID=65489 RepID=A0A0D3FPJ7_9ORYZ
MPPVLPSSTMMASSTLWLRPRGEGGGGTRPSCRRCSPPPSPSTCGDGGRAGCASAADALPSWRRRTGRLRRTAVAKGETLVVVVAGEEDGGSGGDARCGAAAAVTAAGTTRPGWTPASTCSTRRVRWRRWSGCTPSAPSPDSLAASSYSASYPSSPTSSPSRRSRSGSQNRR